MQSQAVIAKDVLANPVVAKSEFTARQGEVLAAALDLLVAGGDNTFTMAGVAARANCSKETLYKWFKDRDGLLGATIGWQAAKVVDVAGPAAPTSLAQTVERLEMLAQNLLVVLTGEVSLALNRLAISRAGTDQTNGSNLGQRLLRDGKNAAAARIRHALEVSAAQGHLTIADLDEAARTFYGLVVRDGHIRLLLGEGHAPSVAEIGTQSQAAVSQFVVLYRGDVS